jgi:hypothetical protein
MSDEPRGGVWHWYMGWPLVALVLVISVLTMAIGLPYIDSLENKSVDGFNSKLEKAGFSVGGMRLPYEGFSKNEPIMEVDSVLLFLNLNKECWHYTILRDDGVPYDGHWAKPEIYWEPHYADHNPAYDFWFSNGTTVFVLRDWQNANIPISFGDT